MIRYEKFNYTLSKDNPVLVISLKGSLSPDSLIAFEKMARDILSQKPVKYLVLEVSHLSDVSPETVPAFVELQNRLRQENWRYLVAGVNPNLQAKLLRMNALSPLLMAADLQSSLTQFLRSARNLPSRTATGKKVA